MGKPTSKRQLYDDTITDIYDLVTESGTTRADMQSTLNKIGELCVDAKPEIEMADPDDDDDDDDDDDADDDS